jgi:hypothetical protein
MSCLCSKPESRHLQPEGSHWDSHRPHSAHHLYSKSSTACRVRHANLVKQWMGKAGLILHGPALKTLGFSASGTKLALLQQLMPYLHGLRGASSCEEDGRPCTEDEKRMAAPAIAITKKRILVDCEPVNLLKLGGESAQIRDQLVPFYILVSYRTDVPRLVSIYSMRLARHLNPVRGKTCTANDVGTPSRSSFPHILPLSCHSRISAAELSQGSSGYAPVNISCATKTDEDRRGS